LSVHRCVRGRLLSIPIVERIRFAAYVGALSGGIVLVGLIIYFLAHLREPYAAFEVLFTFTLAIVAFPLAVIFRDARRKRRASTTT
jgi:ABC-type tungstate transport system substrate-binding protein